MNNSTQIIETSFDYKRPLIPLKLDKIFFIILHHTGTKTATPQQIHQWHLENDWNGFGYNEYIRKDGNVFIGRGDHIGAQTYGMNSKSYGIALEGNFDEEYDMTDAQFYSLIERIKFHQDRFPNNIEIANHNRFTKTSCPGYNFSLDRVKSAITSDNKYVKMKKFEEDFKRLEDKIKDLQEENKNIKNCLDKDLNIRIR